MFEDEAWLQLAEISGAPVTTCDVCGTTISEPMFITDGIGVSTAACDRVLRVCRDCNAEIVKGELAIFEDVPGNVTPNDAV